MHSQIKTHKENNIFKHQYNGLSSPEGYGVCSSCGARENTDRSSKKCNGAWSVKGVKVRLDSGREGYVISDEFFIVGSEVKVFERIPESPAEWGSVAFGAGIVAEIL